MLQPHRYRTLQAGSPAGGVRQHADVRRLEDDIVDLFVERRERTPEVELLVRAKTNRVLGEDARLLDDTAVDGDAFDCHCTDGPFRILCGVCVCRDVASRCLIPRRILRLLQ